MRVELVMDELLIPLKGIEGLRVLSQETGDINPPCAVLSLPGNIDYEGTYARGLDSMMFELAVLVGRSNERASKYKITPYCEGAGPSSIKQKMESHEYRACDTVTVKSCHFANIIEQRVGYLAAIFTIHVAGQGSFSYGTSN